MTRYTIWDSVSYAFYQHVHIFRFDLRWRSRCVPGRYHCCKSFRLTNSTMLHWYRLWSGLTVYLLVVTMGYWINRAATEIDVVVSRAPTNAHVVNYLDNIPSCPITKRDTCRWLMLEYGKMQMEAGSAKSKVCKGSGNKSRILTHALRPCKGIEIENRKENECKRYQIQRGTTSKVEKEEVYQLTNMVFIVLFTAFSCCFYSRIWGVWIS